MAANQTVVQSTAPRFLWINSLKSRVIAEFTPRPLKVLRPIQKNAKKVKKDDVVIWPDNDVKHPMEENYDKVRSQIESLAQELKQVKLNQKKEIDRVTLEQDNKMKKMKKEMEEMKAEQKLHVSFPSPLNVFGAIIINHRENKYQGFDVTEQDHLQQILNNGRNKDCHPEKQESELLYKAKKLQVEDTFKQVVEYIEKYYDYTLSHNMKITMQRAIELYVQRTTK